MIIASIAFYVFAAILLVSAAMVVTARNPVHSVLFLILAFFNAAALFLIAGAEFLAMILVIVYVGAVAVLFLFVVMMLDIDFAELREGFQRYAPVGATVGLDPADRARPRADRLEDRAGGRDAAALARPASVANTVALGRVLYTDYVFLFQTAGLILLVAMIGAIVLTLRDRHGGAAAEHRGAERAHASRETLELVDVRPGAGIRELGIRRPRPPETAKEPVHGSGLGIGGALRWRSVSITTWRSPRSCSCSGSSASS